MGGSCTTPPTLPAAFTPNPRVYFFPFSTLFLSQELKALHHSAAAQHPNVASSPPHPKGCLSLLCTLKHQPGWVDVPLPITPTPPRHFLLGQPTLQAFNTPSHRHPRGRDPGMRGSGLQAPSPLTLPSHGASAPPASKCMWGAGIDTPKCPQTPMLKIQKHAGLLLNALQQGPALLAPWHTQRLGGPGGWRGGIHPVFPCFQLKGVRIRPSGARGGGRGELQDLAGAALLPPLLSVLWGRRKTMKRGKK